jgi:transcriptional regulator with XRE-family HTH domain
VGATGPSRELAVELIRYRTEHQLSQTALANRLAVSQPRIAKLESGEHNPDFDTTAHVVEVTGIELCFDFLPAGRESKPDHQARTRAGDRRHPLQRCLGHRRRGRIADCRLAV